MTVDHGLEAALPPAIARAAEELGVRKARYGNATLFVMTILGGAFISLGGLFATVAMAGADGHLSYGVTRLLGGGVFSLGLVLILIGGALLVGATYWFAYCRTRAG
ncbi:Formate/nitrite transporter [Cupriavidus sp. YR651]|uniref:formate/nitrite transporter family protein n=1 Tax=Cupriavidus sp. YR651 TaxID=1855315 RepID=UPI000882E763|nr:formate/nitrite transporter family protein [Cupriavidus sp. YR651]SDC46397.1 Formate/nitrite transporter [Cupriavidus sp. YR651]